MIKETTRGADNNSESFPQLGLFLLRVLSSSDRTTDHVVKQFQQLLEFNFNLHTELSGWREHYTVGAIISGNLLLIQRFVR